MRTLVTFCLLCISLYGVRGQWVNGPAYPGGSTDGCYSFTIGNRVFAGGGLNAHKLFEYNHDNTWTDLGKAAAGGSRGWAFAFAIGTKAYVCGGANGGASNLTEDLWEYDIDTKVWTKKADMPMPLDGGFAFSVGGKGYIGCGFDGAYVVDGFYEYDPQKDEWKTLNDFPQPLIFPSSFVIDGKGYVVGGAGASESTALYRYEPYDDSWEQLADFPGEPRQAGVGFTLANTGYYGGGMQGYTVTFRDLWSYDAEKDSWANTGFELPNEYTAWQTATGSGASSIGDPQWAIFVAGAAFINSELRMTNKTFRFTPGTASVRALAVNSNMVIYPNPVLAGEILSVRGERETAFSIIDIVGREVLRGTTQNGQIPTSPLGGGSYSLVLKGAGREHATCLRFIVQ